MNTNTTTRRMEWRDIGLLLLAAAAVIGLEVLCAALLPGWGSALVAMALIVLAIAYLRRPRP